MDYLKIYDDLVERAKNRRIEGYIERHHILPKCMGGNNEKDNIVKLTAREHFISHLLLSRIYPNNKKLIYALWRLVNSRGKQGHKISSRSYEKIKLDFSRIISLSQKNRHHTEESKKKISISQKDKPKSQYHKEQMKLNHLDYNGEKNPRFNTKHSAESKQKMREKAKLRIGEKNSFFGKNHTEESKLRMKDTKNKSLKKSKYKIICLNNNQIYLSLRDIQKDLKLNRKEVSFCCKGFIDNVHGYKFEFV